MISLFIDSSRKELSVALINNDKLISSVNVESYSKHSNFLMNTIKSILSDNNISINDVDNFVVLNGPGSFTGVRVGITILKSLAWVLSKKIYTLSTLEAQKLSVKDDVIISVIKDKNDYSYVGIYEDDTKYEDYISIEDEKLNLKNKNITIVSMEKSAFTDNLVERLSNCNNVNISIIDSYNYINVINYALSKPSINPHSAKPIYLKKIDAEKKNNAN